MSRIEDDADRLQQAFAGMVRALGLLRPDTTPCGQPITITEAHALSALLDCGTSTQQQLADTLGLQKSTVSRLVDQLATGGLVTRSPNPDDRRSVLVGLTANGAARARRLARARRDLFTDIIQRLDAGDRRAIVAGLTRLEEVARART
jgi:DNA-binding MarR family transcriptional regulator